MNILRFGYDNAGGMAAQQAAKAEAEAELAAPPPLDAPAANIDDIDGVAPPSTEPLSPEAQAPTTIKVPLGTEELTEQAAKKLLEVRHRMEEQRACVRHKDVS